MGRLIDEEDVIKILKATESSGLSIEERVALVSTAYDVEKKLEALKSQSVNFIGLCNSYIEKNDALNTVKR